MAASNRAARLTKLVTDLKKRFKPSATADRPLFETLIYATLVENSTTEEADKALAELEKVYFDWNEVRVSSRAELAERLKPLNDPSDSADRLKRTLQSVFETIYAFDMESFKKQNLGQAVKQIAEYDGVTPFVVAYVTQRGLSGHAIAINSGGILALQVMEIITEAEAKKYTVPGLERAIPKNKGREAQAVLHEMGVEINKNPYGPAARKLMTELDPSCKDRLPKRPKKVEPKPAPKKKADPIAVAASKNPEKAKKAAAKKEEAAKKPAAKKAPAKPAAEKSKPATKSKPVATKKAKKAAPKKAAGKKPPVKKKSATKKAVKKAAPKGKKTTKKAATKKATAKKKPTTKKKVKRKPK